jgi:hypothetical protein
MTESSQSNSGGLIASISGYAGAGPLELALTDEPGDAYPIHVGWPGGGMFITIRQAAQLSSRLMQAAQAAEAER